MYELCRCCCGRPIAWHVAEIKPTDSPSINERWHPYTHTESKPTDAYGTLEFQGAPHASKAQVGLTQTDQLTVSFHV